MHGFLPLLLVVFFYVRVFTNLFTFVIASLLDIYGYLHAYPYLSWYCASQISELLVLLVVLLLWQIKSERFDLSRMVQDKLVRSFQEASRAQHRRAVT